MKKPDECENMADIRAEIDRLDRQIVALIGQRFAYVTSLLSDWESKINKKAPSQAPRRWLSQDSLFPQSDL